MFVLVPTGPTAALSSRPSSLRLYPRHRLLIMIGHLRRSTVACLPLDNAAGSLRSVKSELFFFLSTSSLQPVWRLETHTTQCTTCHGQPLRPSLFASVPIMYFRPTHRYVRLYFWTPVSWSLNDHYTHEYTHRRSFWRRQCAQRKKKNKT